MSDQTANVSTAARNFWLLLSLLLLLFLLGQLFLLFSGGPKHRLVAERSARDIEVNLGTGEIRGRQHEEVIAETKPAEALAISETPPSVEAPAEAATPETPSPSGEQPSSVPGSVRLPLNPSPNPNLTELVGALALPKIGPDGTAPAVYYRKPLAPVAADVPRIALIVDGLGLRQTVTEQAEALDENVTLAYTPYAPGLNAQTTRARNLGHEVWLDVPLQPDGYPADDAGPYALLATESGEANLDRLRRVLGSATGYVGLIAPEADIASSGAVIGRLMEELRQRGLMLTLRREVTGLPQYDAMRVTVTRSLPASATAEQWQQSLSELEGLAKNTGYAVAIVPATPGALDALKPWAAGLSARNIALLPLASIKPVPAEAPGNEAASAPP